MLRSSIFGTQSINVNPEVDREITQSGSKFTAKVFLYMFIALAITSIVTIVGSELLIKLFSESVDKGMEILAYTEIGVLICLLPIFIWIQISVLRGGKGLTPAFVIYSILMGLLFAPIIAIFTEINLLSLVGMAFGITCGIFAILALIAWTSKKDLSHLSLIALGLLFGVIIISVVSIIIGAITGVENGVLSAIVSVGFFLYVLLITLVDLHNVRKIASRGQGTGNLAMVCAFSLYADFVYVFIKVLTFLLKIFAKIRSNR